MRTAQKDDAAFVGRALPEPSRDDRHLFQLTAHDRLQLVSLVVRRDELGRLARGFVTFQAPRQRQPARQHHMRCALGALARHDHQVVLSHDLAQPGRAMRQRGQRF